MAQPLGEHARLARAGRGDHPGRSRTVGDGPHLVGRQVDRRGSGCGPRPRDDREQPLLDRLGVHDRAAQRRAEVVAARTTVDPRPGAVGQHDVARGCVGTGVAFAGRGRAQAQRLAGPPPDRPAVAGVVGVGPDQEVQAVGPHLDVGTEPPGLVDLDTRRLAEPCRVDAERHHHRSPVGPGVVQRRDHPARTDERRLVDRDHRRAGPWLWDRVSDVDDDPAAEPGGWGGERHGRQARQRPRPFSRAPRNARGAPRSEQ
jgi:hypothetical protein